MRQEEVRQEVRQRQDAQVDHARQVDRAHLVHLVRLRRVHQEARVGQGGPERRALRVPAACRACE